MPDTRVTVVIPTLQADETLAACLRSLESQTLEGIEIIVVDNSGEGRARGNPEAVRLARIIENQSNRGYGGAVNQGVLASDSPFILALNDDTVLEPGCLAALLREAESRYEIGMCAPQIRRAGRDELDSAGMVIAGDGSTKQRGHGEPAKAYSRRQQALLPSGCAALYRRDMLEEIGLFDERFFLYCEDSDLGLRARWKLWECVYVPDAVVEHRYSHSAGSASALKAFYVERNRLFLIVKNFPAADLVLAPLHSAVRYVWHLVYMLGGKGKTADYRLSGGSAMALPWMVLRAHFALLGELPRLVQERRRIRHSSRMQPRQFRRLLKTYRISTRQVAAL